MLRFETLSARRSSLASFEDHQPAQRVSSGSASMCDWYHTQLPPQYSMTDEHSGRQPRVSCTPADPEGRLDAEICSWGHIFPKSFMQKTYTHRIHHVFYADDCQTHRPGHSVWRRASSGLWRSDSPTGQGGGASWPTEHTGR